MSPDSISVKALSRHYRGNFVSRLREANAYIVTVTYYVTYFASGFLRTKPRGFALAIR